VKAISPIYLLQFQQEVCQWEAESGISPVVGNRFDAWVVGRNKLLYRLIDVGHVEKKHRIKALEQQVRQMSPFQNTGSYHYPYVGNGSFSVWIWDENVRLTLLAELVESLAISPEALSSLPVYPEPCLKLKKDDGESVTACGYGYDQQKWASEQLVASRWLPPEALGTDAAETKFVYESSPWTGKERMWVDRLNERSLLLAVAGVLLFFLLFPLGRWFGWEAKLAVAGDEIRQEQSRFAQVIAKRDEAIELQASNQDLKAIVADFSHFRIMAIFDETITSTSLSILEWKYDQGKLTVSIFDEELDNRSYVEQLSAVDVFRDVRVDPGIRPGEAVISMSIGESP
jgi:hypothetical protein